MAAGTTPIFSQGGDLSANGTTGQSATMTTATGDYTGVSANHVLVHTAGANGSYIKKLRFKAIGTNTASVARVYHNNGSTNTTASNNLFYDEVTLPATTASNTSATVTIDLPMDLALKAGERIYVGVATTVAAGWVCSAVAGQY